MKPVRSYTLLRTFVLASAISSSMIASAFSASVDLQTFKTHSRLILDVDSDVDAQWTDRSGGFELLLPGLTRADLSLNEDSLGKIRDVRLRSIRVVESEKGLILRGEWNFSAGDAAPADPRMERFQYREKSPSRFLVDFWPKEGPSVGDLKRLKVKKDRVQAIQRAEDAARKRQKRRENLEKALRLQEDVSRFCREPLKDGEDVFLPFRPFHEAIDFSVWLPEGSPDQSFQYLSPSEKASDAKSEKTSDAKYVNLALDLYRSEKYALVIRTLDFRDAEKTASSAASDREMRFLRANAYLKLGQTALAQKLFQEIKEQDQGHPTALFSALYLAGLLRKEGNTLGALEAYLWLAQHYPTHRLAWVFRLVAAESLYALNQSDRAIQEYEWVTEHAPTRADRALAAVRIGDAYLLRFQYDRALAAYFKASEKFPAESSKSASLRVNRAESLYWLGQHDRAESALSAFVKDFPGHPAGWRAYLRLAEVIGRKPGAAAIASSRENFLKTVNHHPFSPGATLARLRLIPCGDHGGFTPPTAQEFFEGEAKTYTGGGEIVMDRYRELRAMLRVRGLILLNDTVAAVDAAIEESEGLSSKSTVQRWIGDMQRQLFRKNVLSLLEAGKKFEALQFYDKRIGKISLLSDEEDSDRLVIDPDYLLRLSRAASDLGMGKLALKISSDYEKANSAFVVARGIASGPGNSAELDERLKASEKAFTQAKAIWVDQGAAGVNAIRPLLAKVIDESSFSFQREIILGQLEAAEKKISSALKHAMSARLLLAQASRGYTRDHASVEQWIAKLQIQAGQTQSAIATLRSLQAAVLTNDRFVSSQLKLPVLETREEWILAEADLLEKAGRWGEAATAYEKLVNEGKGGNRAQVQWALALEKTGRSENLVRSNEILKKVSESPTEDFWRELARKAVAGRNSQGGQKP